LGLLRTITRVPSGHLLSRSGAPDAGTLEAAGSLPVAAVGAALARRPRSGDRQPLAAPGVTSAANPHYQKRFDELHKLAAAGDWAAVRDYKVSGSNSYSKLVARYQQDLLALHAAWDAAQ
jgi:hypothetical protein